MSPSLAHSMAHPGPFVMAPFTMYAFPLRTWPAPWPSHPVVGALVVAGASVVAFVEGAFVTSVGALVVAGASVVAFVEGAFVTSVGALVVAGASVVSLGVGAAVVEHVPCAM